MFKVGDKVRCISNCGGTLNLTVGEIYEIEVCEEDKYISVINDLGNREFYYIIRFELVEDKKMEKTFKEVIADIKEGEVWESCNHIFQLESITLKNGNIDFKYGGIYIEDAIIAEDGELLSGLTKIGVNFSQLFKLKRKQYTFTEAFESYEQGKEIESLLTEEKFNIKYDYENSFEAEEVRDKWYINN